MGLRERKKQRTRETIARVALDLFERQGYAETTIAEIAAAADVAPRTVSGYFPAKEDLVFPDREESLAELTELLERRGPDQLAPQVLRVWIERRMEGWKGREQSMRAQQCVIAQSEALQAQQQLFMARLQNLLAAAIAEDLGAGEDDLEPRIAAAATIAIIEMLAEQFGPRRHAAETPVDVEALKADMLGMLDRTVSFVSAGIRALQNGRAD